MKTSYTQLTLLVGVFLASLVGSTAAEPSKPIETKLTVSVLGAVRHPGRYAWATGLTIDILLLKAGGLTADARKTARVVRSTARSTRDNLAVDLAKDPNFELMANDIVHFERTDRDLAPDKSATDRPQSP